MLLRLTLALACAAGLCVAQSKSASPSSKEIPPPVPSASETSSAQQASAPQPPTQSSPSPSVAPAQPAPAPDVPAVPAIDAPPERKNVVSKSSDKNAKPATAPQQPEEAPYVIGKLDVLIIKVWGQPNLSGPVDVGIDGKISLPLIGEIKAEGRTKEALKAQITKALSDFLNNPEIDVQIGKINSKFYYVYGGAGRPGEFPLVKPTTVMDAISTFGGFREFANTKKIRIQRTLPSGQTQDFQFNYKDVSKGKHMEQNIYLQNGDRVFVPE